jgi:hypothetical protein
MTTHPRLIYRGAVRGFYSMGVMRTLIAVQYWCPSMKGAPINRNANC